jgi:uncharacterized damage-inducible protein DinB
MNVRELLIDTLAYIPPARALEQLSCEDAERRPTGASHSIAEIVAHAAFWQDWYLDRCDGAAAPIAPKAAEGWPAVAPRSWPDVHDRFIRGLERAVALAGRDDGLDRPITPPIEFAPLAEYTVRDALVHVSVHNAHHLGQVITLRQMMGLWPPPSGSWTW